MDAADERTLAMAPLGLWSVSDVAAWLHGLELSDHADAFMRSAIDGPMLAELTPDDLATLGVRNKFHARKILQRRDRLAGAAPSGVASAAAASAHASSGALASGAQRDGWPHAPPAAHERDEAQQWGGVVAATPPASPGATAARAVPPATPVLRPSSPPPSPPPLLLPPSLGALSHAHQARRGGTRAHPRRAAPHAGPAMPSRRFAHFDTCCMHACICASARASLPDRPQRAPLCSAVHLLSARPGGARRHV
jgi:hypothetical protein